MKFKLVSDYKPTGDQPKAIEALISGFKSGVDSQVLLGVTGSGKTFSIANAIQSLNLPTLVISHNKTLATQLYQEFRDYFPENAVSYFVSYYDYYQPEAYIPKTDTYIAKEVDINEEIDKLRLLATSDIFSRCDVVVIASVSCIYNIGSPEQYQKRILEVREGQNVSREDFLYSLVSLHYQRSRLEFSRGNFRIRGSMVEIYLSYIDKVLRIGWEGSKIERISLRDIYGENEESLDRYFVYPAKHYLADEQTMKQAFSQIRQDLKIRLVQLEKEKKLLEANRLEQRVNYDLEMLSEVGYINGIENYSRYFDGRMPGDPPFSLLDYFKYQYGDDFLVVVDESHMTVPQIRGMYAGDKSRKQTLIDFGFRLPSALDNRPLQFSEYLDRVPKSLYVSATPDDWEIEKSSHRVVEQLIRPTGLVDPEVEVRPIDGQIPDLISEIIKRKKKGERVLITTLTKKMAEELSKYLENPANTGEKIEAYYLHSDIDTLKRSDILADLRTGKYDVIVGINLLREGLDLPEVSLVAILDADKQGFLRSKTSLVQTMGRAARNVGGKIIMYGDEKTKAMKQAISEVERRRRVQLDYNLRHGITPKTIMKPIRERIVAKDEEKPEEIDLESLTPGEAKKLVAEKKRAMRQAAKELDFEKAAKVRDEIEKIISRFNLGL